MSLLAFNRRPAVRRLWRRKVDRTRHVRVRVKGGYEPGTIVAVAGEPLRITFRREESAPSSERVVFPAFGVSASLPAYEEVTLELLPEQPGDYEFTSDMGILRGRLVVSGPSRGIGTPYLPARGIG